MKIKNEKLSEFTQLIDNNTYNEWQGELRTGIDLGTANIVLAVVDEKDHVITGISAPSKVVRDGIVVDYIGAIQTVKRLKSDLENRIGRPLLKGAVAIPPGIQQSSAKCIANVAQDCDFEVTNIVDEPTAAASILEITDGAVVDVGGGTTGISILKDGKVIFTNDEPTGGVHMTLALQGYYGIAFNQAEEIKKDTSKELEVFSIIKPVIEKMAAIVKQFLVGYQVPKIFVVGGACCFDQFEAVFEKELGIQTVKSNDPLWVTPLGIAQNVI